MNLRANDKLFLLDFDEMQIVGAKLPSIGQVLRVFLYNLRKVKLGVSKSANLVIKEVEVLWCKARIPTRGFDKSVKKIVSIYNIWHGLKKNWMRQTSAQRKNEQDFVDKLDDLFDIAHANAMDIIKIEEDKQFLINQRKKGRPGSMVGGDQVLAKKENRKVRRQEIENRKFEKHNVSFPGTFCQKSRYGVLINNFKLEKLQIFGHYSVFGKFEVIEKLS